MQTLRRACNSKFRIISSKDFPVGPEEQNRQEHSEQAKPQKRCSSIQTRLRVISPLKLVCDRVLFFPARAWLTINRKTLPLVPKVLRKNAASRLPMESDPRAFL
jgi:hypothetical protein